MLIAHLFPEAWTTSVMLWYTLVLLEAPSAETLEGASIVCHFVRHGGTYIVLLPHDSFNNFGHQLSSVLSVQSTVDQVGMAAIVITSF